MVYAGRADLLAGHPTWTLRPPDSSGTNPGWQFGASVALPGDLDGDGYADLVIGAACAPAMGDGCGGGRVYVYPGGPHGLDAAPQQTLLVAHSILFGARVATASDINADGLQDLVGGDPSGRSTTDGYVYLFLGAVGGGATNPFQTLVGPDQGFFGGTVARRHGPRAAVPNDYVWTSRRRVLNHG